MVRRALRVISALALAACVATGCGSNDAPTSSKHQTTPSVRTPKFDVSFVPADATWMFVVQLADAPWKQAREVGERVAGWPLVADQVPDRRATVDAVLHQVGLAPLGGASIDWMGREAGAAVLPGATSSWLVWADVRDGHEADARRVVDGIVARSRSRTPIQVRIDAGRLLLASSPAALERSRRAQAGHDSYAQRIEWTSVRDALHRRTAIAAIFGYAGGGVVSADELGVRFDGASSNHRCENLPMGDAFHEIVTRRAGAPIVRASADGPVADARELLADQRFAHDWLEQLVQESLSTPLVRYRSSIAFVQSVMGTLDVTVVVPGAARIGDDAAFRSARRAIGDVPDDASAVWWFDTDRMLGQMVDGLRARGRLSRTEAAIARTAGSGIDGMLLWVTRTPGPTNCIARIGLRVSIPPL